LVALTALAAPVRATAQVQGMTMEQNFDRPGSEYALELVNSPEACAQRCQQSAACASYTAFSDTFVWHCSLKDAIAAPAPSPGRVSGIKQRDSLSLLTLNMTNSASWEGAPWPTRYGRIADWMATTRLRPDLLLLQEVTGWKWCFGLWDIPDYGTLDALLSAIQNRVGLPYRVAYLAGWSPGPTNIPGCVEFGANAVLYRSDRLINLTPSDSAGIPLVPHQDVRAGLHLRRSLPQCNPPSTWFSPLIDGPSTAEKCATTSHTGPAWATMWDGQGYFGRNHYARFALRTDPARSIDVFDVHPLTDEPNFRGLMAIRAMTRTVAARLPHRQPYYPALMAGDFNTAKWQMEQEFPQFAMAYWPADDLPGGDDVIGVMVGRAGTRAERFGLRVDLTQRVPPDSTFCGPDPAGISDHCGGFVQFVNAGLTASDIALTGGAGWTTLPVARSNGDGSFHVTNLDVGVFGQWSGSVSVRLKGDYDGDGLTDLALAGGAGWNSVPIAFANGDGSFRVTNLPAGDFASWLGSPSVTKLTSDFNGDGRTDIALTGPADWTTIPIGFSNGDGSFRVTNLPAGDFAAKAAAPGVSRLAGDFDGDGRGDIALVGGAGWTTIPVAYSSTSVEGSFWTADLPAGIFPGAAAVPGVSRLTGDFNSDGRSDIALVGGAGWTTIPVARSRGDGSFDVTNLDAGVFAGAAAVSGVTRLTGDFDGDGRTDLALLGGTGWNTIPVARSNGDGSFQVTNLPVNNFAAWAGSTFRRLTGDFNGDGRTDLALVGGAGWTSLPVAFSNGDGTFQVTNSQAPDFATWATASGAFIGELSR
jgi:hypothetical protein